MDAFTEVTNIKPGGVKHDLGKLPWHLLPSEATEGLLKVLSFGAKKYTERNWEKGIVYSRVFGATMRHMWSWWRGEDLDPETGLSHLDHAACNIAFLQTFSKREMKHFDDRPEIL